MAHQAPWEAPVAQAWLMVQLTVRGRGGGSGQAESETQDMQMGAEGREDPGKVKDNRKGTQVHRQTESQRQLENTQSKTGAQRYSDADRGACAESWDQLQTTESCRHKEGKATWK